MKKSKYRYKYIRVTGNMPVRPTDEYKGTPTIEGSLPKKWIKWKSSGLNANSFMTFIIRRRVRIGAHICASK